MFELKFSSQLQYNQQRQKILNDLNSIKIKEQLKRKQNFNFKKNKLNESNLVQNKRVDINVQIKMSQSIQLAELQRLYPKLYKMLKRKKVSNALLIQKLKQEVFNLQQSKVIKEGKKKFKEEIKSLEKIKLSKSILKKLN